MSAGPADLYSGSVSQVDGSDLQAARESHGRLEPGTRGQAKLWPPGVKELFT